MDTDKSEHEIIVRRNKHSFTKSDAPFILNFANLKKKIWFLNDKKKPKIIFSVLCQVFFTIIDFILDDSFRFLFQFL